MAECPSLDFLVKESLKQWGQRPPGLKMRRRGRSVWLRGRPCDDTKGSHPFLKLPGSTRLRTLPDGLWLNFGGTVGEPFVDIFAIEACSTTQNLLDKRSRFAPSTHSLVAVCPVPWMLAPVMDGDTTPRWQAIDGVPPALEQAIDLVGRWPEAADQWPRIIHTIQCFTDAERPGARLYSASHSVGSRTGVIGLTPHCPLATAQALVHEMAHTKLRAMGVDNENAIRIVTNPPREMFFSPVVGEERPMTAVLHAQYSFIHVLQLDILMLETEPDEQTRSHIHRLIARNVPRMDAGRDIVARFMRMDRDGEDFMAAFLGWTGEVLKRGHELLRSDAE